MATECFAYHLGRSHAFGLGSSVELCLEFGWRRTASTVEGRIRGERGPGGDRTRDRGIMSPLL